MICPECNGRGESIYYIETHRDENSVTVEQRKGICRTCNGSGKKRQTNADRIRAMTDEELAELIVKHHPMYAWNKQVRKIYFGFDDHRKDNPQRAWREWLKQPAEVE